MTTGIAFAASYNELMHRAGHRRRAAVYTKPYHSRHRPVIRLSAGRESARECRRRAAGKPLA